MESNLSEHIYIHVPFCIQKCRYCDFYSRTDLDLIPAYVTALIREIGLRLKSSALPPKRRAATVYFGGGTPSLLGPHHLHDILHALDDRVGLGRQTEITFEANPETLDTTHLTSFQDLGINRVSLGVQSLEPSQLSILGRRHTAGDAVDAVEKIRAAGLDNVSIDLIYGFGGQTKEALIRELEAALSLAPAHLSCYMLTLEPDTVLDAMSRQGTFLPMNRSDQVSLFRVAATYLASRGWDHYEVSSFARHSTLRSRHNSAYWQMAPCHGFGPGAHGYAVTSDAEGGAHYQRVWNLPDLDGYIRALASGTLPASGHETLTLAQRRMEYVMVGLRTATGLDIATAQTLWEDRFLCVFQRLMADLEGNGLARFRDGGERFVLTLGGWMRLDSIVAAFVEKI